TRLLADAQALETAHALAADTGFAVAVMAGRGGVDLPVVGLFSTSTREEEPALAAVRGDLEPGWREERRHARDEVLRRLPEHVLTADAPIATVDRVAPPYYGLVERLLDVRMNEAADDILRTARPVDDAALRTCAADACRLGIDEAERLAGFRRALERGIVRLLPSTRPAAGTSLVLAMARLVAVDRSLRAGRWAVLDGYGVASVTVAPADVERRREALEELRKVADAELAAARTSFAGGGGEEEPLEMRYAAVESAANRLLELDEALRTGHPLRMQAGMLVPSRGRRVAAGRLPWPQEELRALAVTLARWQRRHAETLTRSRG